MNKNDENKKNNNIIIIGIAAFSFAIAIAIIAISFFAPKSHSQVKVDKFEKAAYAVNKLYSKPVKDGVKQERSKSNWEKKTEFKQADFVNTFNTFDNAKKTDQWDVMFKEADKTFFPVASAKLKDPAKFFGASEFANFDTFNFEGKFYSEKWM